MLNTDTKMLERMGISDAYTAATEFIEKNPDIMDQQIAEALLFTRYLRHPYHTDMNPGNYTDDTEMSIANAKVLINYNFPFKPIQFAEAYVYEFVRNNRRKGYAKGFYNLLSSVESGFELLKVIKPNSVKNGAAMRSVPLGVLPSVEQVIETANLQAKITHDTHPGFFSARAVALLSHFSLHSDRELSYENIYPFMAKFLPREDWNKYEYVFCTPWDGSPVTDKHEVPIAITTVHAVTHLLNLNLSLLDTLKTVIQWMGDTDSVASIACGILSARKQEEQFPTFMYHDFEKNRPVSNLEYLNNLNFLLMQKYGNLKF